MKHVALASLSLVLATSALLPLQKRASDRGPADFKGTLASAQKAWDEGKWGACIEQLDTALGVVRTKRAEAILAALPAAPEGWTTVKKKQQNQANPFAAMMGGLVGNMIEQEYKQESGGGSVKVTLTADSPMVQMFNMMIGNPAMLGEGKELIEYDDDRAVLETKNGGKNFDLQILIAGKHLCQVETRGITDDMLFKIFDQAAVDRLSAAMTE